MFNPTNMLLRCQMTLGRFVLDLDVSFESRVASIFGPSGSGKTTLLDAIAGLREIQSGEIQIGDRSFFYPPVESTCLRKSAPSATCLRKALYSPTSR